MGAKKQFVLDTNVVLHDYKCIYNFEENDIYLPIVVLEELDKFKKGNDQINFNARQFARELDDLIEDDTSFTKGVSLGEGKGSLFIVPKYDYPDALREAFVEKTPDHLILGTTLTLQMATKTMRTILVTKDINMRIKARSIGITAEDYINDKVTDLEIFNKSETVFEDVNPDLIDRLYASNEGIDLAEFPFSSDVEANDCFVIKSNRATVLARYVAASGKVERIDKKRCFGIEPRNAEQSFAMNVLLDDDVKLVALTGRSGTGKTLLALAAALQKNEDYKQILLARPVVALANKDLGALPGDAKEKVLPYMQPLFDNLNVIKHNFSYQGKEVRVIDDLQKNNQLIIEALAYIRGRSLSETYFIIDEAQNLTPHEIKTIITRAGEGTKLVFTGDVHQIDSPYLDMQSNGLVYMIDRMKGQDIFAHVNLLKGERSYLSELASNLL
ncbi:MAG: PhoH family protein [Sphingobacteriia bacterium]|jgi:PhoH-like ATPase|nr:PhoH family protein [Paludibacteraceae bacterium]NCA79710.1 PhoH family protein [Sphingobacteriia bacterium]